MDVDRRAQVGRPLPERIVAAVVEIDAVGLAIDQRALEAEIVHAALQLVGCHAGVLQGEMGKSSVAVGAFLDLERQHVVALLRQLCRSRRVRLDLHSGPDSDSTT